MTQPYRFLLLCRMPEVTRAPHIAHFESVTKLPRTQRRWDNYAPAAKREHRKARHVSAGRATVTSE
jgi:hypothetical protein